MFTGFQHRCGRQGNPGHRVAPVAKLQPGAQRGLDDQQGRVGDLFLSSLPGFAAGVKATFSRPPRRRPSTGDLWYNAADGLLLSQWDGTDWVPFQIGSGAIGSGAVTSTQIATGAVMPGAVAAGDTTNPNPFFSGGDISFWTPFNGAILTGVPTTGLAYPFAAITTTAGQSFPVAGGPTFPANPGDPVQVNGWLNSNCGASLAISFFDSGGSFLGDIETDIPSTGGAWQYVSCVGIVPVGATGAGLAWGMTVDPTAGTEVVLGTGMTVLTKVARRPDRAGHASRPAVQQHPGTG